MTRLSHPICALGADMSNVFPRNIASPPPIAVAGQGCYLYDDCQLQPQITRNFLISSNHLYAFFLLSIIGFFTYKNSNQLNLLNIYLVLLSIVLEILHIFIPERSFEFPDLFGNLFGVLILVVIQFLYKK